MRRVHFLILLFVCWVGSATAAEPHRKLNVRQVIPDPNDPAGSALMLIQVEEFSKDSNGKWYVTRSYPVVAKTKEPHAHEFDPTLGENDWHRLDTTFGKNGVLNLRDWEGKNLITNPRIVFAADGSFALAGELSSRGPETVKKLPEPQDKILSQIMRLLNEDSMLEAKEREGDIKPTERSQMEKIDLELEQALLAHAALPKSLKAPSRRERAMVADGFVSRFSSAGKPIEAFGLNGTQVFGPLSEEERLGAIAMNPRGEIAVPSVDRDLGLTVRVYRDNGGLLAERKVPRDALPPLKRGGPWIPEASVTQDGQTKVLLMAKSDWLLPKKPVYEVVIPHDSNHEPSVQGVVRVSPKNALTGEPEGANVYGAYSGDGNTVWIASNKDDATKVRSFKVGVGNKPTFGPVLPLEDRGFGRVLTLRASPATDEISIVGRFTGGPEHVWVYTADGSGMKPFQLEASYSNSFTDELSMGVPTLVGHTCSAGYSKLVNQALSKSRE